MNMFLALLALQAVFIFAAEDGSTQDVNSLPLMDRVNMLTGAFDTSDGNHVLVRRNRMKIGPPGVKHSARYTITENDQGDLVYNGNTMSMSQDANTVAVTMADGSSVTWTRVAESELDVGMDAFEPQQFINHIYLIPVAFLIVSIMGYKAYADRKQRLADQNVDFIALVDQEVDL